MTYEQFLRVNDNARNYPRAYSVTLDRVSYRQNFCFFPDGSAISINMIVQFVQQGQFYLANPSKISKWKGFTPGKRTPKRGFLDDCWW